MILQSPHSTLPRACGSLRFHYIYIGHPLSSRFAWGQPEGHVIPNHVPAPDLNFSLLCILAEVQVSAPFLGRPTVIREREVDRHRQKYVTAGRRLCGVVICSMGGEGIWPAGPGQRNGRRRKHGLGRREKRKSARGSCSLDSVGERVRCIPSRGHVDNEITQAVPVMFI
ncbi:hypothetical protein J6590_025389 [Homalodisca vitripennis]|nr:hypothetical protein J6590_025389 [Homalodisca vitripennis]